MRLIEQMESEVANQIKAILDQAKKDAAAIEDEAKARVEELKQEARLRTEKRIQLERARRSAKILQAIKKEEAESKQALLDKAFDQAQTSLKGLDGKKYDELFVALAADALADLDCEVEVSVKEGDKKKAEAAVKEAKVKAQVQENLKGQGGGLVVKSPDGRIFIDNTLFTRLSRSRTEGSLIAGNILFGGKEDEGSAQ